MVMGGQAESAEKLAILWYKLSSMQKWPKRTEMRPLSTWKSAIEHAKMEHAVIASKRGSLPQHSSIRWPEGACLLTHAKTLR